MLKQSFLFVAVSVVAKRKKKKKLVVNASTRGIESSQIQQRTGPVESLIGPSGTAVNAVMFVLAVHILRRHFQGLLLPLGLRLVLPPPTPPVLRPPLAR